MSSIAKQQTERRHAKNSTKNRRVPSLRNHKATGQAYAGWSQNSAAPEYGLALTVKPSLKRPRNPR